MKKLQTIYGDGGRPSFWLGGRKHTLFKIVNQRPWYVRFNVGGKDIYRSTRTDDAQAATTIAAEIILAKREELGFARGSMAKTLTQARTNLRNLRNVPAAFEVLGQWYCVQKRDDRASWFVRFAGLNGKDVSYSTQQSDLELAKARAAGFVEGYRQGLIEMHEQKGAQ